jgi:hypothetical protein
VTSEWDKTLHHGIIRDEQSEEGSGGYNGRRIVAARSSRTKEDAARTAFKEKEGGCTVRLFGTNSLKKGAV